MGFESVKKVSIFRKVAMSTWNSGGDPSVYGFLEIDLTGLTIPASPLPILVSALAQVMKRHKELNSVLRFGKLYYRKNINISVIVNIPNGEKCDLSFATIENADELSCDQISELLSKKTSGIRKKEDPHLGTALKIINWFPVFMTKFLLRAFTLLTHDLNWNLSALRLPRNPFGSVMISNVGSLGIKNALVPLVPFSRSVLMISIGQISDEARVVEGEIKIRKILHLGMTFDHRFFDGSHAARMISDLEAEFKKGARYF